MRLLLDTHIWIWMLLGSEDLPEKIRRILEDPGHEMFLSPISIWEALILPLPHKDPADRFIAATALVFDLFLVTVDKRLRGIPKLRTISM